MSTYTGDILIQKLEEQNKELLKCLIEAYRRNFWWGYSDYHRWTPKFEEKVAKIIEKETELSIKEAVK